MKILLVSSEAVPFAKTGGLADVVGALAKVLRARGHDARIFLPLYRSARAKVGGLKPVTDVRVEIRGAPVEGRIHECAGPAGVPYLFLECDRYYDRDQLYSGPQGDFADNCERFAFFSRALCEALPRLGVGFDVIHAHDWQAALVPVYLKTLYAQSAEARGARSLVTIHNLAYQGVFWHWDMGILGLDWKLFNQERLEFYGKINFLKGGIIFADGVNTVSRTYAKEVQSVEFGNGLDGVLRTRPDLTGILNGADYDEWSPEKDRFLPQPYSATDLGGKAACKALLQKEMGLPANPDIPLLGMVTRLDEGKGIDILTASLDEVLALDVQAAIVGAGSERYQRRLGDLADQYRGKLSVRLAFDERLSHLVQGGSDMLLMPSRYEPCGLNQLYALRYGAVPIVRATGGLADTVVDASRGAEDGTGFSFSDYTGAALALTVSRAVATFSEKRRWRKLMLTGMAQDWSWSRAAGEYEALYARLPDLRVS